MTQLLSDGRARRWRGARRGAEQPLMEELVQPLGEGLHGHDGVLHLVRVRVRVRVRVGVAVRVRVRVRVRG